jgi:hypothetical protein
MSEDNCLNCGHPKAEHTKYDVVCLKMSGWSEAELGSAEPLPSLAENSRDK